ncbi:MAG: DapH/DapD/GlmU-related protein [Actinomycetaceae bacterium]|nr:DapH/DapD/GlmU-related protein [Actinomycetaceae bacterium]MDU0969604.1 DapH/DapD/GlmU-related protein [Actinomycetaceae bacterium]
MNREEYQAAIDDGGRLEPGSELAEFMTAASERARRIYADLNGSYHTPDEVRGLMSELIGEPVADSVRVFPPFYSDFGLHLHIGADTFINSGVHVQDQGGVFLGERVLVGHDVVFATVNHDLAPKRRGVLTTAPIHVGDDVWIGAKAVILPGVTIGEGAVVAAGAVITRDVEPYTVVGGVPAKAIKQVPRD